MSFYGRQYRGFGAAVDDRMLAAIIALNAADATLAAANARVAAAKTLEAQLTKMDSSWWKRVDSYFTSNGPLPGDTDAAFYKKYNMYFPINWQLPMPGGGGVPFDFDKENPVLEEDKQKADDEVWAATEALPAAKDAVTAAKKAHDLAEKEIKAVNATAAIEFKAAAAKAKVAADVAQAKAMAKAQALAPKKKKKKGPSPLLIAGIAVPVLGVLAYALTRKKSTAVAGYRRRRSRR